jgi:hypothetical protein
VTDIEVENDEMGGRRGRVRFQFEADRQLHRGSDEVSQGVADRWRPGDQVEILYLPEDDYGAMIISTDGTSRTPAREYGWSSPARIHCSRS